MRLRVMAGSLLALSSLFLVTPLARGGCGPACCTPANTTATKPAGKRRAVPELVSILDKTESKDTFLLTVMVLRKMGPEAKEALPSIIRNAERLGLVKGVARAVGHKRQDGTGEGISAITGEICQAMMEIASATRQGKQPLPPVACYAPAPAYNQPPQVVPAQPAETPPSVVPAPPAPPAPPSAPTVPLAR